MLVMRSEREKAELEILNAQLAKQLAEKREPGNGPIKIQLDLEEDED
jgi:hypothetical protein